MISHAPYWRLTGLVAGLCWALAAFSPAARAADPTFVGVLALATQPDVAARLGLSADTQTQLAKLIDDREAAALDLSLKVRSLPAAEQQAKLVPFRQESERLGLQLLKPDQQKALEAIRLERVGLASLAEPQLAEQLKLTTAQQTQIAEVLKQRGIELTKAEPRQANTVNAVYERKLAALLTDTQRAAWDDLAHAPSAQAEDTSTAKDPSKVTGSTAGAETPASSTKPTPTDKPTATDKPLATDKPKPSDKPTTTTTPTAPNTTGPKSTTTAKTPADSTEKPQGLRFNFAFQPWKDVLTWFAKQADLSLVMDNPPPGTFNYQDTRVYTPAEAIDLLNGVLLTKGFTLVRRERMLMLVNLQDGVPANLVPTISLEDLDNRGQFELVSVIFHPEKLTPEEFDVEVKKLLGPQGSTVVLGKAGQVMVTETAGRLRTIRSILKSIDDPLGSSHDNLHMFTLQHVSAADALATIKQLMNIPADRNATADGSLRIAIDTSTGKLLGSGKPDAIARVDEILKVIDVPGRLGDAGLNEQPQLEIYSITSADPDSVLAVLTTMLAGQPDVRVAKDPKTGNIIALARPAQQATIKATLAQMQRDSRQVEVIHLHLVDPQLAVISINKLFAEGDAATAPKVEADASLRQILIRGTDAQILQIRSLLEKMGETSTASGDSGTGKGNTRFIPLSGRASRTALQQLELVWPTTHKNKIHIVSPSATIPSIKIDDDAAGQHAPGDAKTPSDGASDKKPTDKSLRTPAPKAKPNDETAAARPRVRVQFATQEANQLAADEADPKTVAPTDSKKPDANKPDAKKPDASKPEAKAATDDDGEPATITVAPGANGVIIASEDTKALDDFEALLTTLASRNFTGGREYTVFYLKYAKAASVGELLGQIFGGGSASSSDGGSIIGNLAGAALGDVGGGLVGDLLGVNDGGGSGAASKATGAGGPISIVPDSRLNALVVQANSNDLDTIEQLLKVLDQKSGPEDVLVLPPPKMIPVYNTSADSVATVVKQVYQDRLAAQAGQQRQPTPQELFQMLRGGGGRGGRGGAAGGGNNQRREEETPKMNIGVDSRTNSLVVSAPEPLFNEVKGLVEQLDQVTEESNETMKVVTLKRTNPQSVQQALTAIAGDSVKTTAITGSSTTTQGNGNNGFRNQQGFGGQGQNQNRQFDPQQFRQRMQQMQGGGNGNGFGGGNRGGNGPRGGQ